MDAICKSQNDVILADGFTRSNKPRIIVVEKKEDATIFERGCRVISIMDGNIEDMEFILSNIIEF